MNSPEFAHPTVGRPTGRVLLFVGIVAVLGGLALIVALRGIWYSPPNLYVLILALLTLGSRRFTIKVPGRSATISVSEVFVFASILLFGPEAAIVTVALDGLWMSLGHRDRRWHRTIFNIAEPPISTWAAGTVFFLVAQTPPLTHAHVNSSSLALATLCMAAVFFLLNGGLVALAVAYEAGGSAVDVWRGYAVPLAINYYASASVAAIAVASGRIDYQVIGLVIPLLVLSYATFREASVRVDEAQQHARAVERLYEEAHTRDEQFRQAQKLEAVGRLAGGVAHDFNNMLTAIMGYGELVFNTLEEGDVRRGDMEQILKAADRSASLTKQLLAFSRQQAIAPQVLSLDHVVSDTEKMLRRLLGEDVQVATHVAPDIGLVYADAGQIQQVLLNLAVNARDAMTNGGALTIALASAQVDESTFPRVANLAPGRYVRLSVTDTGSGMTAEVVSHIFEPFFTTKEVGRGTGLGLAMVYGIVTQAGGAIDIDTEVGRGTTFHLYLPETSRPALTRSDDVPRRVLPRGAGTVLVVEDEAAVLKFVVTGLRQIGYTVLAASSGAEAIAIMQAQVAPVDLLVTDVVMPGMNGRELADILKPGRKDMRVLFMSGYTDDAVMRCGIESSRVEFLQKPFSLDALLGKVQEVLSPAAMVA